MKKHLIISGKVQGVGFRYWLHIEATKRKVRGYVKNTNSGKVEAILIGNDESVKELIEKCKKGPSFSKVIKVEIQDYRQDHNSKSFDILRE